MRPDLTPKEIDNIKSEFELLMSKTPYAVYEQWKNEGSFNIVNRTAIILPRGIEGKLHGKLASDFVSLLNKNNVVI